MKIQIITFWNNSNNNSFQWHLQHISSIFDLGIYRILASLNSQVRVKCKPQRTKITRYEHCIIFKFFVLFSHASIPSANEHNIIWSLIERTKLSENIVRRALKPASSTKCFPFRRKSLDVSWWRHNVSAWVEKFRVIIWPVLYFLIFDDAYTNTSSMSELFLRTLLNSYINVDAISFHFPLPPPKKRVIEELNYFLIFLNFLYRNDFFSRLI